MTTKLSTVRPPSRDERKRGADVVFERKEGARRYTIYACRCYESWEQWGAPDEVLADNVRAVELWRRAGMLAFEGVQS